MDGAAAPPGGTDWLQHTTVLDGTKAQRSQMSFGRQTLIHRGPTGQNPGGYMSSDLHASAQRSPMRKSFVAGCPQVFRLRLTEAPEDKNLVAICPLMSLISRLRHRKVPKDKNLEDICISCGLQALIHRRPRRQEPGEVRCS